MIVNAREAIEDTAREAGWSFVPWDKVTPYPNGTRKVSYTRGRFIIEVHYSRVGTVLDATLYMEGVVFRYAPDKDKRAWVRTQLANGKLV